MLTTRSISSTLRSMPGPTPRVKAFNYKLRTNLQDRIAKRLQMERRMSSHLARKLARQFVEKLSLPQLSRLENRKVKLDRMLKVVGYATKSTASAPAPVPESAKAAEPKVVQKEVVRRSSKTSKQAQAPAQASAQAPGSPKKVEYDNIWAAIMEYDSVKRDREKLKVRRTAVTKRDQYSEFLGVQVEQHEARVAAVNRDKAHDAVLMMKDVDRFRVEEEQAKKQLHAQYMNQQRLADEQIAEKEERKRVALVLKTKEDAEFLEMIKQQERDHQAKLRRLLDARTRQMEQAKLDLKDQMEYRAKLAQEDTDLELRLAKQRSDDQDAKEAARKEFYAENKRKREAKQAMMDKFVYSQRREEEARILKATENAAEAYFKKKVKEEEDKKERRRVATVEQMAEIDNMIRIKKEREHQLKLEDDARAVEQRRRSAIFEKEVERKKQLKKENAKKYKKKLEKQIEDRNRARRDDSTSAFELKVNEEVIREVLNDPNCPVGFAPDIVAKLASLPKIGSKLGKKGKGKKKGTKLPQI